MIRCKNCGGTHLSSRAFVDLNTKDLVEWDDVYDEVWCDDCGDYVETFEGTKSLIIMDYSTSRVNVYTINDSLEVDSDSIRSLGYNVDEVDWMISDFYNVEEHSGIITKFDK